MTWWQWRAAHPDGWALSRQTGHALPYGSNRYYGYGQKTAPLFYDLPLDNRIEWLKQPVVGIVLGGDAHPVDIEALQKDGTRAVTFGEHSLTMWWLPAPLVPGRLRGRRRRRSPDGLRVRAGAGRATSHLPGQRRRHHGRRDRLDLGDGVAAISCTARVPVADRLSEALQVSVGALAIMSR
jgi:hypothetical protein